MRSSLSRGTFERVSDSRRFPRLDEWSATIGSELVQKVASRTSGQRYRVNLR